MAEDDDERLRSGLERLQSSLSKARQSQRVESPAPRADDRDAARGDSGMSLGMRAGSEFITAVVLGAGIGWGLDRLLGTNPLFLIAFFFLGAATAVWSVIRMTSPKGGGTAQDSALSHPNAADKGLRRSAPTEPTASRGRTTPPGTNKPSGGADDDED